MYNLHIGPKYNGSLTWSLIPSSIQSQNYIPVVSLECSPVPTPHVLTISKTGWFYLQIIFWFLSHLHFVSASHCDFSSETLAWVPCLDLLSRLLAPSTPSTREVLGNMNPVIATDPSRTWICILSKSKPLVTEKYTDAQRRKGHTETGDPKKERTRKKCRVNGILTDTG